VIHDPMRQADIERRLANLARAQRCGARTRAGHPCKQAAVRGRARCRMHGGARGSGGPRGDHNGNFKQGLWTNEAVATRKAVRAKIREIKALLQTTGRR
jgi:glucans biosynthesis protein